MTEKRKPIPQGVRFNVLRRDGFACRYCGRKSPQVILHLDHVQPYSKGGEDTESNLITACQDCNFGKGAKLDVSPPVITSMKGDGGLVGFFGHTYRDDEIQYQFRVLRQVSDGSYAVQLFSWVDGNPTDVEVWPSDAFQHPKAKLYENIGSWNGAYEQYSRRRA